MRQFVGNLYDDLAGFEALWGQARKERTYSIHKRLYFERSENSQHLSDINEWILEKLPLKLDGKVLDAGCGVGNTLLTFCQNSQMSGLGISLSAKEIAKAQTAAQTLNLANRCQFVQQAFTAPLDQQYDTIIAIESLKHAPDLTKALSHLASALKVGGHLIIVEDFGEKNWKSDHQYRQAFLQSWMVQRFYTLDDYTHVLSPLLGNDNPEVHDFTPLMEIKNPATMLQRYTWLNRIRPLVLFPFLKSILATFAGGFLLDYFYAQGLVKYQLLCIQRKQASR